MALGRDHDHGYDHDHPGHSHAISPDADRKRLGAALALLGSFMVVEGVRRLISPPEPGGLAILVVALVGVVVNLLATWQMAKANRTSLNVEGAYLHVLTDLYAFVGTAIAGVVILLTGFARADGIAALGIPHAAASEHPRFARKRGS